MPGFRNFVANGIVVHNSRQSVLAVKRGEEEGYDRAQNVYEALSRRIKSRFEDCGVSGMMFLVSSKRGFDDFTERRIRAAKESGDPGVFVRDYASWDVKPDAFKNSKWYTMAFSQTTGRHRYVKDAADRAHDEVSLTFPEEFKGHFDSDAMAAAQDYGGISFEATDTFITNRAVIDRMMTGGRVHPFQEDDWQSDQPLHINWDEYVGKDVFGQHVPLCCPSAPRHVHIDISKNHCATGFCIGHLCGTKQVWRIDPENGKKSIEEAPIIHIDFVLRILAPPGGEIEHSRVRGLVHVLLKKGVNIRSVTMDRYCSVPNLQEFRKMGVVAKEQSTVITLDPYLYLRTAMIEDRVECAYYEELRKELRAIRPSPDGRKILKGEGTGKDLADALAVVVYWLANNNISGQPLVPQRGVTDRPEMTSGPTLRDGEIVWPDEALEQSPTSDEDDEDEWDLDSYSYIVT